jgi:hypothetical protein
LSCRRPSASWNLSQTNLPSPRLCSSFDVYLFVVKVRHQPRVVRGQRGGRREMRPAFLDRRQRRPRNVRVRRGRICFSARLHNIAFEENCKAGSSPGAASCVPAHRLSWAIVCARRKIKCSRCERIRASCREKRPC